MENFLPLILLPRATKPRAETKPRHWKELEARLRLFFVETYNMVCNDFNSILLFRDKAVADEKINFSFTAPIFIECMRA